MRPQDRVSPDRFLAFIKQLQARVSAVSTAMMTGALARMFCVIAPSEDWGWLNRAYSNLKRDARASRNRLAHLVRPEQLYDLGLSLMREALDRPSGRSFHPVTTYRDGLMIAMLICCPVRISNLKAIEIGQQLQFDRDRYWLDLMSGETKTGRPYQGEFPSSLTPQIDHYIRDVRPLLLRRASDRSSRRLWIDRWGEPLSEASIRAQIKLRTRKAFGCHVWPHLFRHCAVTGLVDLAPEDIRIAPDLLGHSDIRTAQRHYILASGAIAHKKVQTAFIQARCEALQRLKDKKRKST
jgi:integrase